MIVRNILLSYPTFSGHFITCIDASKTHLRGVISKNCKPHRLLIVQVNSCTNQLYNNINRTVKYSGNPEISLYHSIRTLYNIIYRPQKLHDVNKALLEFSDRRIRPQY